MVERASSGSEMSSSFVQRTYPPSSWPCRLAGSPHPSGVFRRPFCRNSLQRSRMARGSFVPPVIIWVILEMQKTGTSAST